MNDQFLILYYYSLKLYAAWYIVQILPIQAL